MDPAFLAEARENAASFGQALLELEGGGDGDRAATVRELFRFAHNIKGMAAMEGADDLAGLAHAAEDLLSRYRDDGGVPTAEEIDALLAASDLLEGLLDALDASAPPPPSSDLVDRLRALLPPGADPVAAAAAGPQGAAAPGDGRRFDGDAEVARVLLVALADRCAVPRARAMVVVRAATEAAPVVGTDPADLADLDPARPRFAVGLSTVPDDPAGLAARLQALPDVAEVEVRSPRPPVPTGPAPPPAGPGRVEATVRVEVSRLDALMDLVGELVIEKNRLVARAARARAEADRDGRRATARTVEGRWLDERIEALARLVAELREAVGRARLVSLEATFGRMQRLVRDVSRDLGKPLVLTVEGEQTELDRSVVDEVVQPLVHLLRNAADHGIEDAATRAATGKPAVGGIRLRAAAAGPEVVIEVADDGGGIDTDRLGAKAVERGLVGAEELARLPRDRVLDLMFLPGFSSRDEAGMVSGRGVGLDVVQSSVQQLGGSVGVTSTPGLGTTFQLRFPLSLLVMDALLVRIGDGRWALPLVRVEEAVPLPADHAGSVDVRGASVPVIEGADVLAFVPPGTARYAVVVTDAEDRVALAVDELLDHLEVVVKPVPPGIEDLDHLGGVTILGEGDLALVPDLAAVVRRWRVDRAAGPSPTGPTAARAVGP